MGEESKGHPIQGRGVWRQGTGSIWAEPGDTGMWGEARFELRMSFRLPSRSIGGSRHCLLHTAMTWCKWLQRVDDTAKGEAGRVLHALPSGN